MLQGGKRRHEPIDSPAKGFTIFNSGNAIQKYQNTEFFLFSLLILGTNYEVTSKQEEPLSSSLSFELKIVQIRVVSLFIIIYANHILLINQQINRLLAHVASRPNDIVTTNMTQERHCISIWKGFLLIEGSSLEKLD